MPLTNPASGYRSQGPLLTSGTWLNVAPVPTGATVTFSVNSGRIHQVPFFIPRPYTIGKFWLNVTGTAAGNARLGIYNLNQETGALLTLVVQTTANIDVSSTGIKSGTCTATVLAPGFYSMASFFSSTPTITGGAPTLTLPIFGYSTAAFTRTAMQYRALAFTSLPSDETGQSYTDSTSANIPLIGFTTS